MTALLATLSHSPRLSRAAPARPDRFAQLGVYDREWNVRAAHLWKWRGARRERRGVAWLPMADDGDGAVDDDVTVLQPRHMLGTKDVAHAIQSVGKPGSEEAVMRDYFPRGQHMTVSACETADPCPLGRR